MFDIGFWELALIFVLAVVVFGPERLPGLARKLGRFAAQGRLMMRSLQAQLEEEINLKDSKPQAARPPAASIPAATDPAASATQDASSQQSVPDDAAERR